MLFITVYDLEVEAGLWNCSDFTSKECLLLYFLAFFPDFFFSILCRTTLKNALRKPHRLGKIKAFFGRPKDSLNLPEEWRVGTSSSTKLWAAWSYVAADEKRAKETAAVEKNRLNTAAEQKNCLLIMMEITSYSKKEWRTQENKRLTDKLYTVSLSGTSKVKAVIHFRKSFSRLYYCQKGKWQLHLLY